MRETPIDWYTNREERSLCPAVHCNKLMMSTNNKVCQCPFYFRSQKLPQEEEDDADFDRLSSRYLFL